MPPAPAARQQPAAADRLALEILGQRPESRVSSRWACCKSTWNMIMNMLSLKRQIVHFFFCCLVSACLSHGTRGHGTRGAPRTKLSGRTAAARACEVVTTLTSVVSVSATRRAARRPRSVSDDEFHAAARELRVARPPLSTHSGRSGAHAGRGAVGASTCDAPLSPRF